jgi:hypothetical protein
MRLIVPLFALALVLATPASGSGSGIRGRVTSSPTCPVETIPPNPRCAPRGFKATLRITRNGSLVRRLTTDASGRFSVALRPGRYRVLARPARGSQLPRCPGAVTAKVSSGRFARVAIDCDSGIR